MAGIDLVLFDKEQLILGGSLVVGRPIKRVSLASAPSSFESTPTLTLSQGLSEILLVISDTELEVAMCREDDNPANVLSVPLRAPSGGLGSITVLTPSDASYVYIKTRA